MNNNKWEDQMGQAAEAREPMSADLAEMARDPHGYFARHRALTPVLRSGQNYYVIRGRDVLALLGDPTIKVFEGHMMALRGYPTSGPMSQFMNLSLLPSNGAVHRNRRAPLAHAFSRRIIEDLRPMVREEARTLAAAFPRGVAFDFLDAFASPLPGRVIAKLVGLDPDNWRTFASLIYKMTQAMAPPFPADRWDDVEASAQRLYEFVAEAVADRRARPQDDFLTAHLKAAEAAGALSEEEIQMQVVTVLLGGSDTTRGSIAILQGHLLEDRSRWEAVLADRDLVRKAVLESLRHEPIVASTARMAAEAIEVGGVTIPQGSAIELMTISAMRDAEIYTNPDVFDLQREDGPQIHPVFGSGVHRCLGEQLARLELEEGLAALADLAPGMQIIGERPAPRGFSAIRDIDPLIVRID